MLKTSNVNTSHSHGGFAMAGWDALHKAVLDRGAETDYHPSEYSELKTQSYVDEDLYFGLIGRVLTFADISISHYEYQSTLVSHAVWQWIRSTAISEIPEAWRIVIGTRSWTALLAAFGDWMKNEGVTVNGPSYRASDLRSVAQFGYWLFRHGQWPNHPPIAAILWGLALIGAAWSTQLRCGRCALCFRQSRPGETHCDFHSQSAGIDLSRSLRYQRYRCGRRARELAMQDPLVAKLLLGSPIERSIDKHLALPDALFPFDPDNDGSDSHILLIQILGISPRVVTVMGINEFRKMPYEDIIENLRQAIDPNNWNNDLWDFKVLQAERWLELEEKASPAIRGQGRQTAVKVLRAIQLAGQGLTKSQIAIALDVTPSAVSKWIKRYPDFQSAMK